MADRRSVNRRSLEPWLKTALFLGLFVYVWKGGKPSLLYWGFGTFTTYPVFSLESSFLHTALTEPGGVVRALAALAAQSYQSDWLGALVIATALGTLLLGVLRLLRSVQAGALRDLAWIPPILVLMVYNRYEDPLPLVLAGGLPIWAAVLYGSLSLRTLCIKASLFLLLFACLYYLAGTAAFIFAIVVCLTEALLHRKIVAATLSIALASSGAFLLGQFVCHLEPQAIWTVGTPWAPGSDLGVSPSLRLLAIALYAFAPGLVALACVGRIVMNAAARRQAKCPKRGAQPTKASKRFLRRLADKPGLGIALRLILVTVTAVLCLTFSRTHIRHERALHYFARHRAWNEVVTLAHRMRGQPAFTRAGVFDINRALAHQGQLGGEFCAYPQHEAKTLFLNFEDTTGRLQYAKLLELYLDLGCLNAAEKNAYEMLEHDGPSPYVLEAMVRIHLAKGQYESAQVVFRALDKYVGGRAYARRWEAVMGDPAQAKTDPQLQIWRRVASTRDSAVMGVAFEPTLKRLLLETPNHRLAFEYLMAYYLLKHQRARFVGGLPWLEPLGYKELPRHFAEALLVHSLETRSPLEAPGFTIDPDLQRDFRQMRGIVINAQGNHQAVFDTLAPKYGDTYTFYSMFNVCGLK